MRKLWSSLPGPAPAKAALAIVGGIVALVLLLLLFEWAGSLLDSGGAIG